MQARGVVVILFARVMIQMKSDMFQMTNERDFHASIAHSRWRGNPIYRPLSRHDRVRRNESFQRISQTCYLLLRFLLG